MSRRIAWTQRPPATRIRCPLAQRVWRRRNSHHHLSPHTTRIWRVNRASARHRVLTGWWLWPWGSRPQLSAKCWRWFNSPTSFPSLRF